MLIFGIDPGYEGGIAILDTATGKASVYETPVLKVKIGGKTHRQYLHKRMLRLLQTACTGRGKQSKLVVIEEQHLFGREGRRSAYAIGMGYALWLMAITAAKLPYIAVNIVEWKNAMSLSSDKEQSRQLAIARCPDLAHDLRLKKSHGMAEALLLAYYYQDVLRPRTANDEHARKSRSIQTLTHIASTK